MWNLGKMSLGLPLLTVILINMKKLLFSLFLITILTPQFAYAGAAGGGASEFTQVLNKLELIPMNINEAATALSTHESFLKQVILDPIANEIINQALNAQARDIISWVNGGYSGAPLIVSNPGKDIKNAGLKEAVKGLNAIPSNSVYGDSIFKNLTRNYKFESLSLKDKIEEISKTDGPTLLQNSFCDDDNLTSLATEDVAAQGEITNAAIVARKNELYEYACTGNPDDPVTARKLENIAAQRPEVLDWDYMLCVTGGNCNESNKNDQIAAVIEEAAAEKEALTTLDLYEGLNAKSATECIDEGDDSADTDDIIDDSDYCEEEIVTTPADSVENLSQLAQSAGLQRMFNIQGEGTLGSTLSGFVSSFISAGINKSFTGSVSRTTNSSSVSQSTRPTTADLSPSSKASFIRPMEDQMTMYLSKLQELRATDANYIAETQAYESRVSQGRSCWQSLVNDGYSYSSAPAFSFYAGRQASIDTLKNKLSSEVTRTDQAISYVNQTLTRIRASNSTQEITNIFNTYTGDLLLRSYPRISDAGQRQAEYQQDKTRIQTDPDLDSYYQQCQTTRAQMEAQSAWYY